MARRVSSRPNAGGSPRPSANAPIRATEPRPILCAVLDRSAFGASPQAHAEALFAAGVDWIQLRDRSLSGTALYELACALVAARDATRGSQSPHERDASNPVGAGAGPRVIVNKRLDLALAAGADGVHLGIDAVCATSARSLAADGAVRSAHSPFLIGASLHGLAELDAARDAPLDYIQLAPIWLPLSKPAERPALGTSCLAEAAIRAARRGLRVLAQGGLDAARAGEAIAAGAAGIAVTGTLGRGSDTASEAQRLRDALDPPRSFRPPLAANAKAPR